MKKIILSLLFCISLFSFQSRIIAGELKITSDDSQYKKAYFAGGCLGDKDSKCKFGRVDEEIFIKSHKSNSMLHDLLPREHTHLYKSNSYKNDKIIKQSNTVHTHL